MLRNALAWIRQHPVRCAIYALLVAGAAWAGLTARGIVNGQRNALLTRVAQAPLLRGWVDREFHIRYSIGALALVRKCGFEIDVRSASVDLAGAFSGGLDEARVCVSGSGDLRGIRAAGTALTVQAVQFDWPKSISGSQFSWSDRNGEMVSAAAFTASPGDISGSLQNLRVFAIASSIPRPLRWRPSRRRPSPSRTPPRAALQWMPIPRPSPRPRLVCKPPPTPCSPWAPPYFHFPPSGARPRAS
jgi:hypothetical protein